MVTLSLRRGGQGAPTAVSTIIVVVVAFPLVAHKATHHSDHLVQHRGGSSVACLDGLKILGFVPELQC